MPKFVALSKILPYNVYYEKVSLLTHFGHILKTPSKAKNENQYHFKITLFVMTKGFC